MRLKSGAALNLLDLAASATRLARTYDRAEREDDAPTRAEVGLQLIKLGGELASVQVDGTRVAAGGGAHAYLTRGSSTA